MWNSDTCRYKCICMYKCTCIYMYYLLPISLKYTAVYTCTYVVFWPTFLFCLVLSVVRAYSNSNPFVFFSHGYLMEGFSIIIPGHRSWWGSVFWSQPPGLWAPPHEPGDHANPMSPPHLPSSSAREHAHTYCTLTANRLRCIYQRTLRTYM